MIRFDGDNFRARLLNSLDNIYANREGIVESVDDSKTPSTLSKYISNPTGRGSAYVANRAAIKFGLNNTFIKLLREYRKAFYAIPYIYNNGDILFHVKVPSENYKMNGISYDVLFLLYFNKSIQRKNRKMKVYSNSPSFIFTYCYVYNKNDLIIDFLKSKLPKESLTIAPSVRNPIQSFGYEKSTYIAAKYLIEGNCLTDSYINLFGKPIKKEDEGAIVNRVANPTTLMAIYKNTQYESRKKHRKEMSPEQRLAAKRQKEEYIKSQKKIMPKKGFVIKRSPRSKITAKKAIRNLK